MLASQLSITQTLDLVVENLVADSCHQSVHVGEVVDGEQRGRQRLEGPEASRHTRIVVCVCVIRGKKGV